MTEKITVLFFATLRDRAGTRCLSLEIPAQTTVASLRVLLGERVQRLKGLIDHTLVSVNHEYVFDEYEIPAGAEVALFPPVSGG